MKLRYLIFALAATVVQCNVNAVDPVFKATADVVIPATVVAPGYLAIASEYAGSALTTTGEYASIIANTLHLNEALGVAITVGDSIGATYIVESIAALAAEHPTVAIVLVTLAAERMIPHIVVFAEELKLVGPAFQRIHAGVNKVTDCGCDYACKIGNKAKSLCEACVCGGRLEKLAKKAYSYVPAIRRAPATKDVAKHVTKKAAVEQPTPAAIAKTVKKIAKKTAPVVVAEAVIDEAVEEIATNAEAIEKPVVVAKKSSKKRRRD